VRILTWVVRVVVFVLLVAFAAKNADNVTLRFYFDLTLQAPLVLVLFGFFAAGALFGMLALIGTLLRQRREIARLKKQQDSPPEPPRIAGV
jgi:uncharacterized integral membrane protein